MSLFPFLSLYLKLGQHCDGVKRMRSNKGEILVLGVRIVKGHAIYILCDFKGSRIKIIFISTWHVTRSKFTIIFVIISDLN